MNAAFLYRISAFAGVISGGGIMALDLAQILMEVPRRVVGLVEIPITLLVLFALPGLYLIQAARAGKLGLVGFALTFAGVALGMGHFYLMAFVRGVIGDRWPQATEAVSAASRMLAPAELLTFVLGWILLGVATIRARILPRAGGIFLIGGVVLVLIRPLLPLDGPVGGVLMGAGLAWLSAELYRKSAASPEPTPGFVAPA